MSILFELERMERLTEDLQKLRVIKSLPITQYKMYNGNLQGGANCSVEGWEDYQISTPWTETDSHRWLRTSFEIPKEMDGQHVEFCITTGREGQWDATNPQMLCYVNGEIVQGVDVNHREITLYHCAKAGEHVRVALLAYSGSVKGDLILHTEIAAIDKKVEKLFYDFEVPVKSARVLKKENPEDSRRILQKLAPAAQQLDLRKPRSSSFYGALEKTEKILHEAFYTEINKNAPQVSAIGHTHIDIAWLWTVKQTREKVLRSFATVLRLMEQYPDYKFMSSQPILYQFVKEQEPEMYEKIKERIREGRWEVDGAMWLEADCNLPSGESLVRQMIKGERFFREEFGKTSKSLWLPDVFGYSAALPQILNQCNIPYFMTTKIAWNQYNQLPNDTFMWRGIDGSETFVFMPTTCDYDKNMGLNISFTDTRNTTTYTGILNPNMTLGTYKRFQNKDLTEDTIMLFGFGDGGGGPTKEMLENADRLKYGLPGIPRIVQEPETEYFDRTYKQIAHNPEMPTWDGELYFEYHRGTYTSIGKNKRSNRKSEILYEQLETMGSINTLIGGTYPKDTLEVGWDIILLNQFHDIIPGSAIAEVYEQTDKEYAQILEEGKNSISKTLEAVASNMTVTDSSVVVFNTLGYEREDLVEINGLEDQWVSQIQDSKGNTYPVQYTGKHSLVFFAKGIPSVGAKVFKLLAGSAPEETSNDWNGSFENKWYSAKFNKKMELVSLYEKECEKEFIKKGKIGNQLLAFEDRPMNWDNWDIDKFHQKKQYEADWVSAPKLVESGALRTTVRTEYGFQDSVVVQDVHMYTDIPRIDFETHVEWKEHNVLLKTCFPVDVNSTKASFEIQYGSVERETTNNHSWDTAKFETCAHKWADLSENGLGISLLNDCKYGHSIKDGEIKLTLIKSGIYPHENADIGSHTFTYSIYPHSGRWQEARTVEMAYNLNVPALTILQEKREAVGSLGAEWGMVFADKANCFVETIKQAEDGNGLILRMYENSNTRTKTHIKLGKQPKEIITCNLLEQSLQEQRKEAIKEAIKEVIDEEIIKLDENGFTTWFKPFEIKTFRLIF